jgi:tetratricopeptide (TPR) repeat protein
MAGNLGPSPTFVDPGRGFVRLELPKISRMAAADALFAIRHGGVEGAERELDRVLAEHPRSVHAQTYRGELELWIGRYDRAMASFARAALIEPTRWAEIGLVAALAATGRTSAARAMAWFASHHFPPVAGGTLPVYRGMLRRLLGDERAIDDLSTAVAAKPTRVGARIELVLALRAAGRSEEASPHVAQLFEDAPGLLVSAAEALGVDWTSRHEELGRNDVLEEALRAMRGNRSSAIVTWFDRAGELRVLDSPRLLAEKAARALEDVRGRTRARN